MLIDYEKFEKLALWVTAKAEEAGLSCVSKLAIYYGPLVEASVSLYYPSGHPSAYLEVWSYRGDLADLEFSECGELIQTIKKIINIQEKKDETE